MKGSDHSFQNSLAFSKVWKLPELLEQNNEEIFVTDTFNTSVKLYSLCCLQWSIKIQTIHFLQIFVFPFVHEVEDSRMNCSIRSSLFFRWKIFQYSWDISRGKLRHQIPRIDGFTCGPEYFNLPSPVAVSWICDGEDLSVPRWTLPSRSIKCSILEKTRPRGCQRFMNSMNGALLSDENTSHTHTQRERRE